LIVSSIHHPRWHRPREAKHEHTSKARDDRNEDRRLREKAPRLHDNAKDRKQDRTTLRRDISREDSREVHAGAHVVLRDVHKDLMRPDAQASKEGQRPSTSSVVLVLRELENHQRLPHALAVLSTRGARSQDTQQRADGDADRHREGRAEDVAVLAAGETRPVREPIGGAAVDAADGRDALDEAEGARAAGDGDGGRDQIAWAAAVHGHGPGHDPEDGADCADEGGPHEFLELVWLDPDYYREVEDYVEEEADEVFRIGSGAGGGC
jgi:hypothetical protein